MAETPSKRHREETHESEEAFNTTNKRQNYSYNDILSLLDSSEEEEPSQDLSSLITTLQQELSSSSDSGFDPLHISPFQTNPENQTSSSASSSSPKEDNDQEDDKERVMRHLLEASDDELGIPNRDESGFSGGCDETEGFCMADQGLWELEDEAANYYTLLQSELFM